jgi:MFS family permease
LIYLSGNLLSTLGNAIAGLAFMWLLKETTGSTSRAGLTYLASYLPTYFLLPFAGNILDQFSRKKVMQFSQLINAASATFLGFLFTEP